MLRRLRGTPMPPAAYFLGKIWLVLVTGLMETAILLVVGTTLYDVKLPSDPAKWADFAWIFVLGLTACALLGIAISSVPKSGKSATSVVVLPFLVLQFISGVYIAIDTIPDWMLNIGALFPLKWMCQGCGGVPARLGEGPGAGGRLGVRTDRPGAGCLVRRRIAAVSADLPLEEPPRRMTERIAGPDGAKSSYTWDRSFRLWDSYFAVVCVATLVFVLGTGHPGWPLRLVSAALLVALVPGTCWWGGPSSAPTRPTNAEPSAISRARSCCSCRRGSSSVRPG